MSFYTDASLVLIPSGYKDQKVYCAKPIDGSADLTFSRASSATRVASNGLIEKVRTNLCLQSQTIDNATSWSNTLDTGATITVTANYGTAPDGTTTADRIQMALNGGAYAQRNQSITLAAGGEYTYSVYLKSLSGTPTIIFFYDNVNNKTATLTNDWVRYTWTFTSTGNVLPRFVLEAGTSTSADFLAWGCQLETGVATAYIATTSAAVSVGPVSGVPRLDYSGGASCPSLLLEPQRSNLLTFSEQQDNSAWTKAGATITANATTSPDGYTNADKVVEDTSAGTHGTYASAGISNATAYTWSGFFKAGERTKLRLLAQTGSAPAIIYNLTNGTVESVAAGVTASVEAYSNGWYRCIATTTSTSTTAYFNWSMIDGSDQVVYTGDGTSGLYAWGAQIEAGAYATSYIPTLSTSVTRVADAAFKTSATAIIGQTEGTFFAEVDFTDTNADQMYLTLSDGTTNNRIHIGFDNASNWLYCNIRASGAAQGLITSSAPTSGVKKIAVGYKLNDYVLYINGVQIGVDGSALVPACTRVDVGGYFSAGFEYPVKQALLFPTRLSNSDLATLTA